MADLPISFEASIPEDGFECFWLRDAAGLTIGDVYGPQRQQHQEFCELVVKAVNSHDALVTGLENARRDLLALRPRSDTGSLRKRQIEAAAGRIEAILQAVVGGPCK